MSKKVNQRLFRPLLNTDNIEQEVLPEVTDADDGKVLTVVDGEWDKADASDGLPVVTESDNGMILKVVDGEWDKAEAGGGGEWTPDYSLHVSGSKFSETLAQIQEYGLENNKKVAIYYGDNIVDRVRLIGWPLIGATLQSVTYISDLSVYDNDFYTIDTGTNKPEIVVFNHNNNTIVEPKQYVYNGTTVTPTTYGPAILYKFDA